MTEWFLPPDSKDEEAADGYEWGIDGTQEYHSPAAKGYNEWLLKLARLGWQAKYFYYKGTVRPIPFTGYRIIKL